MLVVFAAVLLLGAPQAAQADDLKGDLEIFSWWAGDEGPALAALIDIYKKQNPGVNVINATVTGGSGVNAQAVLKTRMLGGEPPDSFQVHAGQELIGTWVKADRMEDLTPLFKEQGWMDVFPEGLIKLIGTDNGIWSVPVNIHRSNVMWYIPANLKKWGVEAPKTWDDFLAVVPKVKDAGVTPIVVGGKDKWPVHFYYGYLALRIAGKAGLEAAKAGKDGGFENPAFIKAGEEFKKLIDLHPFQAGFADSTFDKASGQFGDGKALFHLNGSFAYNVHQRNAVDGKGLPDAKVGLIPFPAVKGGKGDASDVFGGADGWVVSTGAPKEATEFLTYLLSQKVQERSAELGLWIPAAKGAGDKLQNPFFKQIAGLISNSKDFQLYLDQAFGPAVGGAVNDAAADLALGAVTPKDAAAILEESRKMTAE